MIGLNYIVYISLVLFIPPQAKSPDADGQSPPTLLGESQDIMFAATQIDIDLSEDDPDFGGDGDTSDHPSPKASPRRFRSPPRSPSPGPLPADLSSEFDKVAGDVDDAPASQSMPSKTKNKKKKKTQNVEKETEPEPEEPQPSPSKKKKKRKTVVVEKPVIEEQKVEDKVGKVEPNPSPKKKKEEDEC